jgi:hypothetical protein
MVPPKDRAVVLSIKTIGSCIEIMEYIRYIGSIPDFIGNEKSISENGKNSCDRAERNTS